MTAYKTDTNLLHHGYDCDLHTSISVPIFQTAAYEFESAQNAADLFALKEEGFIYSRVGNPTIDVLEKRLAVLDGGVAALAVSSGQSAIMFAILNIAKAGDNIVASPAVYGGIYSLFVNVFDKYNIEVRFADPDNPASFEELTDENTKAYYGETYPNPRFKVLPIEEIGAVAKKNNVPFIVDNTCTPYICRPLDMGADIVAYSTTKYICGQGTVIGGAVIDKGTFDWKGGNFPLMNDPDNTYHGLVWSDAGMPSNYILRMRATLLRDMGCCPSPHDAFLLLQGLETLPLRIERQCENAGKLAQFLMNHPKIDNVVHTSTVDGQHKQWADKYTGGKAGIMGVYVKGDEKQTLKVAEDLKLFIHAANIGDTKSLVIHPKSTTHSQLDDATMEKTGINGSYLRVSVGIENSDDLMADWDNALKAV